MFTLYIQLSIRVMLYAKLDYIIYETNLFHKKMIIFNFQRFHKASGLRFVIYTAVV